MPVEVLLKSKLARETLNAKVYDLEEVETGKAMLGQDLMNLHQKPADNKPVDSTRSDDEPEGTIMRREGVALRDKNLLNAGDPESNEVVRTLVEEIFKQTEEILKQTTLWRKRVSFKEEAEELTLNHETGEWLSNEKEVEKENLSGEAKEWDEHSVESQDGPAKAA